MFEFEHRQGESDVVAGFRDTGKRGQGRGRKRKRQIEVNSTSSFKVAAEKMKWNGTAVYPSGEISYGGNHLASTQMWRKLLFNNVSKTNKLSKIEIFFRKNINVLLYGIDKCAGNPAEWSKEDTYFFYEKIQCFSQWWKDQLLKENKENSRDWVTNQLNLLTSVYQESLIFMVFSAAQKNTMDSKFKALNDVINTFPSTETLLEMKDQELNAAKKQDDNTKKLKRSSFKTLPTNNPPTQVDPQVMFNGCLQDKEKQLNELKKLLDWGAKKQTDTEAELTETREQLQSFIAKSREMAQTKQKNTIKKLSEIQTLLLMASPNYRSSCQTENESLNNKEEKICQDIKALIEYTMQSVGSEKNTSESALLENNSSSASLRVSEYEIHLVTQIAAYLKVTPFPVSSHYIYSYVANIDNIVDLQFVESLLRKFPSFFKEVDGAPGSMDKNWIYLDLKPVITI